LTPTASNTPTETFTPTETPLPSDTPTPSATPKPKFSIADDSLFIDYGGWRGILDPRAGGGSYRVSRSGNADGPGDTAEFKFNGSSVTWRTLKGPLMGKARLLIDNVSRGEFCLYDANPQYNIAQTISGLPNTNHTLLIQVLGEACGGSDSNVALDALSTSQGTVESTAYDITWSSWRGRVNPNARAGRFRLSTVPNASVKLRFSGNSVRVLTLKALKFGEMRVLIDGVVVKQVSLTNPQWVQYAFKNKGLGAGDHEIVLENVGTNRKKGLPMDGLAGVTLRAATLEGN
jgi:hypothetical protein